MTCFPSDLGLCISSTNTSFQVPAKFAICLLLFRFSCSFNLFFSISFFICGCHIWRYVFPFHHHPPPSLPKRVFVPLRRHWFVFDFSFEFVKQFPNLPTSCLCFRFLVIILLISPLVLIVVVVSVRVFSLHPAGPSNSVHPFHFHSPPRLPLALSIMGHSTHSPPPSIPSLSRCCTPHVMTQPAIQPVSSPNSHRLCLFATRG